MVFTNPLPLSLLFVALAPAWWPILLVTIALRGAMAAATAGAVLNDPLSRRWWILIPLQDLISFAFWLAGFSGNRIQWRGRNYRLRRDGTFELVA